MNSPRVLRLCTGSMALLLLAGTTRAQEAETAQTAPDLSAPDLSADEPLDLSTPQPDDAGPKAIHPLAAGPSLSDWSSRMGIDYRQPSIPAAKFQPDALTAGAIPDQSTGVAWARVTAPGFDFPLGWDQTSFETRVDPSQEQGELGTTLSRSVPVGDNVMMTLQNGVSVTRPLANTPAQHQGWASSQALRFNFLPTDTSLSVGANISSTDEKWLPTLSAEQKLFGGPFSVSGSVSESTTGESSKSLRAGFKRQW
ncbi:MAG: hypothetical protein WBW74_09235 [Xanthobacteraceae bacterium]